MRSHAWSAARVPFYEISRAVSRPVTRRRPDVLDGRTPSPLASARNVCMSYEVARSTTGQPPVRQRSARYAYLMRAVHEVRVRAGVRPVRRLLERPLEAGASRLLFQCSDSSALVSPARPCPAPSSPAETPHFAFRGRTPFFGAGHAPSDLPAAWNGRHLSGAALGSPRLTMRLRLSGGVALDGRWARIRALLEFRRLDFRARCLPPWLQRSGTLPSPPRVRTTFSAFLGAIALSRLYPSLPSLLFSATFGHRSLSCLSSSSSGPPPLPADRPRRFSIQGTFGSFHAAMDFLSVWIVREQLSSSRLGGSRAALSPGRSIPMPSAPVSLVLRPASIGSSSYNVESHFRCRQFPFFSPLSFETALLLSLISS